MPNLSVNRLCLFLILLGAFLSVDSAGAGDEMYPTRLSPDGRIGIVRQPPPADYSGFDKHYRELPAFDPKSEDSFQMDFRSMDLSALKIKDRLADLMYATFDSRTKWPPELPPGFNPAELMALGKNPGLGVRKLHAKGITGKGVGIAVIDQGLLVDHVEYKDRLRMYEEIHCGDDYAQMHGPAVASIAVGKTVGVAPEADLYYIAETHGTYEKGDFVWDLAWLAKSIDRIVAVNRLLKAGKIRVISISLGKNPRMHGFEQLRDSIAKAEKEKIHVLMVEDPYLGLGREPLNDPDAVQSYQKGFFWRTSPYTRNCLLIPMDSRCTAAPTGTRDYAFYRFGGMSWCVPYVAGLYALACQVKPGITPEEFRRLAFETGGQIETDRGRLGTIVDPVSLIGALAQK